LPRATSRDATLPSRDVTEAASIGDLNELLGIYGTYLAWV